MGHVPDKAEWFLAQIVEEIRVTGSKRNVVHINHVIIRARSPEVAYDRAMTLGKQRGRAYVNEFGKRVTIRFRGLRNLDVIIEPLEDGSEIMYEEKIGLSPTGVRKLVRPKRQLEVFLPIADHPRRPNFSSKEIMDEVYRRLERGK